jgi:uncharacterized protein (DUF302 family)
MRMTRYWMTGCMAIMLLAAARWPTPDEREEAGESRGGWISLISKRSVDDTVRQIQRAAKASQLAVVAQSAPTRTAADVGQADGSAEARSATQVAMASDASRARILVLGDAADGHTPAVQADGQAVPDLPMKVLVHQRADGRTEVLFSDPRGLRREPGAPPDWRTRLAALPRVLKAALA